MNPIEKCNDCDRWKNVHRESYVISENDLICALCQGTYFLNMQNDRLEFSLVDIVRHAED